MSLFESYYAINKAIGLGITIGRDEESALLDACQVMVKDKQLSLEQKITAITGMADLTRHFKPTIPLVLNLSGKGILYKQMARIDGINAANFSAVLPNANPDDFYVQHFPSGDLSFVALIRKADADHWIGLLDKQGFQVLMLSLGPFPVQHILPQLNIYGEELLFGGHRIDRDTDLNWRAYRYDERALASFPLKLENEVIDQRLVIPYAAAFQLVLAARLDVIQAVVPSLQVSFNQVLSFRKFRVQGFLVLLSLFLLLLLNFIVLSWLDRSNQLLNQQVSSSTQSTIDAQAIKDRIGEKEVLLRELGWEEGIHKSVLIGEIAALLPPEVNWQEVAVNPVDQSGSRNQRSLQFWSRRIQVRGICPQIIPVNEWIARMKAKSWVKSVQLESYNYNNELNTGQFILTVTY